MNAFCEFSKTNKRSPQTDGLSSGATRSRGLSRIAFDGILRLINLCQDSHTLIDLRKYCTRGLVKIGCIIIRENRRFQFPRDDKTWHAPEVVPAVRFRNCTELARMQSQHSLNCQNATSKETVKKPSYDFLCFECIPAATSRVFGSIFGRTLGFN